MASAKQLAPNLEEQSWISRTGAAGVPGHGAATASGTSSSTLSSFRQLLGRHWHSTVTYCAVFWSFGMCVAFLGPTLLDLGCMTSSDMRSVSWVFLAQLLCSLFGASAASFLVKRSVSETGSCYNLI